jgi:hypothetical protein
MTQLQPHHEIAWTEKFKRNISSTIGIRTSLRIVAITAVLYFSMSFTTDPANFENFGWALCYAITLDAIFKVWQDDRKKKKQESELTK